ncbi:MAG: COX15/CtaA family protein [Geminicoccaceae bacterium]|nr:COX15/CtaA family protein [Geminicoccaceae bacterium]
MRPIRYAALAAAVLTYGLVVLGGWVRATHSGLSCPDWPTCYGHWILTPGTFAALGDVGYSYGQVMLEWTHRLIAGTLLGPLILVLMGLAFWRRARDPGGWKLALGVGALLLVQAGLGGVTVLDQNSPWSVALHLGNALLLFSLLILAFLRQGRRPDAGIGRAYALLAALAWVAALGAMTTAAMTAKSGASLACYTWPDCNGALVPDLGEWDVRIHFMHRALAGTTGVLVALLALGSLGEATAPVRPLALAAFVVVAVQISLGAAVILFEVPEWSQVAHQATGVFLFALLSALMWQSWRAARATPERLEALHVGLRHA